MIHARHAGSVRSPNTGRATAAWWLCAGLLFLFVDYASATETRGHVSRPAVAVIIDDLGPAKRAGIRAVALRGPIAVAILPHTRHGPLLAELAHLRAKEVLLHLPLQPEDTNWRPDRGAIGLAAGREELASILMHNLGSLPHVSGVSNHKGSLFTRQHLQMGWLMAELRSRRGLFFVDSYTVAESVGLEVAHQFAVPALKRDVFLDTDPAPQAIIAQFERLKSVAKENGHAVAIGHPYPATLDLLEAEIPKLPQEGYDLISVSEMLARISKQGTAGPQ